MGFFKRKQDATEPVPIGSIDMSSAREVVAALGKAPVSTDREVRSAISDLLVASDSPRTPEEKMERMFREGKDVANRPWRWLCAVADQANADGAPEVAAMAFLFTSYWARVLVPKLGLADYLDLGIERVPMDAHLTLARAGRQAAAALPVNFVVVGDESGSISAATLLEWAAADLSGF